MAFGLFFLYLRFHFLPFFLCEGRILSFLLSCMLCIKLIYPFSHLLFGTLDQRRPVFFFLFFLGFFACLANSNVKQIWSLSNTHDGLLLFFKHWRCLHPAVLKRLDCRPLERSHVCGIWSRSICFQVWMSFGCFMMTVHQLVAPVMPMASCSKSVCVNQKCQQGFTVQTGVKDPNHPDAIFNKTELCCLPIKYWQNLCILTLKM